MQMVDVLRAGHPPAHPDSLSVPITQRALAIHAKKNLQFVVLHTSKVGDGASVTGSCLWQQAGVIPPKARSPSKGAEPRDAFFDAADVKNRSEVVDLRKSLGCHEEARAGSEKVEGPSLKGRDEICAMR